MNKYVRSAAIALSLLTAMWALPASATSTIFIVRHAEKIDESRDPLLSERGMQRAQSLAQHLRDAGIRKIFVTEFQRTRLTATPLAELTRVALTPYAAKESAKLSELLQNETDNVLVVGHSNTVATIATALGVRDIKAVADDEYDRLIVIHLQDGKEPVMTVLRY